MLSFSSPKGKPIANIMRKGTLITKIKIEQSFSDRSATTKAEQRSKKDDNLVIDENNVFNLPKQNELEMRLSPEHDKDQNFRIVVCAPSGSGKSTWVKNFIIDYRKKYPKKLVLLFSRHDSDPSIDAANPTRVKITEADLINCLRNGEPLFKNENLSNTLCIFDDTFSAESKIMTNYYYMLASDLVQNGRKLGIDIIFVLHNTDYSKTRFLFSEATHFVFFLRSGSTAMYNRLLEQYIGIKDKKILKKLFNLPTRWVVFSNIAPIYIMTENQIMTPDYFEED